MNLRLTRSTSVRTIGQCVIVWLLLILGLKIWTGPGMADIGRPPQVFAGLLAVLLSCVPAINRAIGRALLRLQQWKMPWWVPVAIGIAATIYFCFTAWRQDRVFGSLWQDDSCYEIQARMLARFRLWMPPLPVGDSFDANYLFVRPVYASIYFPGTALLLAPAVLAHLPIFIIPLLTAGAIAALICLIASDLTDPAAGFIASLLWVSSQYARRFAIFPMSHPPLILFSLAAIWAWLRWRRDPDHRMRWMVIAGVAVGWAAITRPLDAACILGPVILLGLWDLRVVLPKRRVLLISTAAVAAIPFLLLMAENNGGITGHWWEMPHEAYGQTQMPGLRLGFHSYDSSAEPQSVVPQKRALYDEVVKTMMRIHTPGNAWAEFWFMRLPRFLSEVMPLSSLIVLSVIGISGIRSWPLFVFTVPLILLPVALAFYAWTADYYGIVVWPAASVLMVLGARRIGLLFPPAQSAISTAATLLLAALAVGSLPEFDHSFFDDAPAVHLRAINRALAALPNEPALVLFRYTPEVTFYEEPVYNTSVAWPDDARIVRAHDLGPAQNAKLFAYYAAHQPERLVYLYDRPSETLTRMGNVKELAKRLSITNDQGIEAGR